MCSPTPPHVSSQQSGQCPAIRKAVLYWLNGFYFPTHTLENTHPSTYTHAGDFVANGGWERDECQASRDGWTSIIACQALLSTPLPPPPVPLFLLHWSAFVFNGVCLENAVLLHRQGVGAAVILLNSLLNSCLIHPYLHVNANTMHRNTFLHMPGIRKSVSV